MHRPSRGFSVLVILLAVSCTKERPQGKSSGPLSDSERALLAQLPSDANIVFGGNSQKISDLGDSSLMKTFRDFTLASAEAQDGMEAYMECVMEHKQAATMVGSLHFQGKSVVMTMLSSGTSLETAETCATKGDLQVRKDEDGKYIEIQTLSTAQQIDHTGHLLVGEDTILVSMRFGFDNPQKPESKSMRRSELEALVDRAKASPLTENQELMEVLVKADRSKPMWFVGTATGTPVASQLHHGYGWADMDEKSFTVAFSLELSDARTASNIVEGYEATTRNSSGTPPEMKTIMKDFFKNSSLESYGKTLSGHFRFTEKFVEGMKPFIEAQASR